MAQHFSSSSSFQHQETERHAGKNQRSAKEVAIPGMPGKSPEDMSVVHMCILNACSSLKVRKYQVHQIRRILLAPNSRMFALICKDPIDASIGGFFKPTYLETNQTHLKNSRH